MSRSTLPPASHDIVRTRRIRYLWFATLTIAAGLAVHTGRTPLGARMRDMTGDALWAVMMVWWIGMVWPSMPAVRRAALALLVCVAVELSQLVHLPWLDALRATTPGHLILGSGFDVRDLFAYAVGVAIAYLIDGRGCIAPFQAISRRL